jgi:hypothetical protein
MCVVPVASPRAPHRVYKLFYERKLDDGLVQMSTIKTCIITMLEPLVALAYIARRCPAVLEENKTGKHCMCLPEVLAAGPWRGLN